MADRGCHVEYRPGSGVLEAVQERQLPWMTRQGRAGYDCTMAAVALAAVVAAAAAAVAVDDGRQVLVKVVFHLAEVLVRLED